MEGLACSGQRGFAEWILIASNAIRASCSRNFYYYFLTINLWITYIRGVIRELEFDIRVNNVARLLLPIGFRPTLSAYRIFIELLSSWDEIDRRSNIAFFSFFLLKFFYIKRR